MATTAARPVVMREYRFLVPLAPEGKYAVYHKGVKWDALKEGLLAVAGGFTDAGEVEGAWKDCERTVQEPCRQFFVSIPSTHRKKLEAIFRELCPKFSQQCIYVASGGKSWLVSENTGRSTPEDRHWARRALGLDAPLFE